MVKIGKTQLLMSDGTIRTFKSSAARDRFESYVERVIKYIEPIRIKRLKIKSLRIKKPKLKKSKSKPLKLKKIRARLKQKDLL